MSVITVIGEGAWGTAIATLLAYNGHQVFLWCHDHIVKETIEKNRTNQRYLPNIVLSDLIIPVTDLNHALQNSDFVFETTPVKFLRSVLSRIDAQKIKNKPWAVLSKGIEKDTLLFPSDIIYSFFGPSVATAVISGPSFALELAHQKQTAVVVASNDTELLEKIEQLLSNNYFKTTQSMDVIGVQLCGALKNVLALSLGIFQGADIAQNTRAMLMTQGFQEMETIVSNLGGAQRTVMGLAGFGDLILTAYGSLSRNTMVGKKIGQGECLEAILAQTGAIPEGVNTLESINQLVIQKKIKAPLIQGIYELVFNDLSLDELIEKIS